jgi:hypothetical protein
VSTFLELVQDVARESGTIPGTTSPATVEGQTGRLARMVHWTRDAYTRIQTMRDDWRWLRHEFSAPLLGGVNTYDPAALGIDRFGAWVRSDLPLGALSLYPLTEGREREQYLDLIDWDDFRRHYRYGADAARAGQPTVATIDPQDRLVLWPTPEVGVTYVLAGEVIWSPQILVADDDVPEMPKRHHDAIRYQALLLMATFDEAFEQEGRWQMDLQRHLGELVAAQTPRFIVDWPLA